MPLFGPPGPCKAAAWWVPALSAGAADEAADRGNEGYQLVPWLV
jgi:hypothetical protein